MEPTKIVKVVEGSYGCFIHYRVSPSLLASPEIKKLFQQVKGRQYTELHLSMSKGFQLSHAYVEPFLSRMRKRLNKYECLNVPLLLSSCCVLSDKFVAFTVRQPTRLKLTAVLNGIDLLLEQFGFEKYYSPPIFHVSVAECDPEVLKGIDIAQYAPPKAMTTLTELVLQVGEKVFKIW